MADQDMQESPGKLSHSLSMGSDALVDLRCDICIEDGKEVEAEGFCVNCSDYLCRECFKGHRKTKMSRNHKLQDKASMPRQKPLAVAASTSSTDAWAESCDHHPDRIAEYYCKDHEQMGCSICMTVKHRTCKGVDHISDLTRGLLESQEFKQFEKSLADLKARSVQIINSSKQNATKSENCSSNAVQKVLSLQKDTNKLFDSLVGDVRKQSEAMKLNDLDRMKTVTETGNKVLNDTERIASNADALRRTGQLCKFFTHIKKTQAELKRLGDILGETESRNTVADYTFEHNADFQAILDGSVTIGQVCARTSPITKDPKGIRAARVKSVNVRTKSDKSCINCLISGIATLPGNKLIMTDGEHNKVKLVDLDTSAVTSELETQTGPWDIAVITWTQVAVTMTKRKEIVFVKVANDLQVDRNMQVEGECRGIAYSSGKLFVTFLTPTDSVAIMNLNGTVERKIEVDNVRWLSHVAYEPVSESIYVTDFGYGSGSVICITPSGTKTFTYEGQDLRGPRGIAVDQLGRVIVCSDQGENSGKVLFLNRECSKIKVLLDWLDRPTGLSYCQQTNKLSVGYFEDDFVNVYQLS